MSTKNQLEIFISAVGGVLALFIFNIATESHLSVLVSAAIGISANVLFVTFSVQWLLRFAMRYYRYRRTFDPRAQFEGYWFATVDSLAERPYDLIAISYNPESPCYCCSGKSLSNGYQVKADWGSTSLEVALDQCRISFFYEGSIRDGNEVVTGFGYFDFERAPSSSRIATARCLFVEVDQLAGAHYHRATMHRIADSEIQAALRSVEGPKVRRGRELLLSDMDYSSLVKHLEIKRRRR
jgi:hypothetical protein